MHILVTGGAGFIGSHLVKALSLKGHSVRVYDSLTPQIHGQDARFAPELLDQAECIKGDVTDRETLSLALKDIDVVAHLAAETGMGQSQYEIDRYFRVNVLGTAVLLDLIANNKLPVKRILISSSARVYGEGPYLCPEHERVFPLPRTSNQMIANDWELHCPICNQKLIPALCQEQDICHPGSMYAVTKETQEKMLHLFGEMYGLETIVLRYQNVYGDGQALRNPYTGVLVAFCNRVRNGLPPEIFEDGLETRDFIHISDIVSGTVAAIETPNLHGQTINIGSGERVSIMDLALKIISVFGSSLTPEINGKFRLGEVRHMQADISLAKTLLSYEPRKSLTNGINELVAWVQTQPHQDDWSKQATSELRKRGLFV